MLAPILMALFFQAPVATDSTGPKPAILDGSVTHAASKSTIRKAKVSLRGVDNDSQTTVETGEDGKYVFKDVKPGRYRVTAEKPGYETTAHGARKVGDAGQVLAVMPGQEYHSVDVGLVKHGAIAGKILDADNEPVAKALVMALTRQYYQGGRRAMLPKGTVPVISSDLGEYRIGQLPPGSYIICAIPDKFYQPVPFAKESKPGVEDAGISTCFPSVTQMSEASALEIKDSTEIPGIDVRLAKSKTVTVHGQITGVPPSAGTVTILNMNTKTSGPMGNALHPRTLVSSADGKFEFKNVPPGSYILHTLPTGLGNAPFVVKAAVEIGDQPVTNLSVPAFVPFQIKAKVDAEPGPELKLGSVRLILTGADEITPALAMGTVNSDGEVVLANVIPGKHRLNIGGLPATHYVREIRIGDSAVDGDVVEVASADTKLAISIAMGKSQVSGVVQNEKGDPLPGAKVALIPEPIRPFRLRVTSTDQNGIFQIGNVAPGEYQAVAMESADTAAFEDEEYLKPIRGKLQRVKVEAEGTQSLKLKVVSRE
ncbi:MAG: carboxypeptidase regulatory-like domain-containing protein [Bryobacterales bacterium]|nr:carboxypeptidase regulatory-like domain-containing protein [Bryobacterales bacterium]